MAYADYDQLIPTIVYFVHRRCTPSWKIVEGTIDFHDLTFVYSGKAVYMVNGREYKLKQGDFIYIPRGNCREAYTDANEPMECYALNFNLEPVNGELLNLPFATTFNAGANSELSQLYEELETAWMERNPGYGMKSRAIFMLILHWLMSSSGLSWHSITSDERMDRVREYILANYRHKISIGQLAELAELNPVYLGALFKNVNHCTISEYTNRIRINNAESLLSAGGYTVGDAALQCGFEDIFYFSKVYKKLKGYPPSNLIRNKR